MKNLSLEDSSDCPGWGIMLFSGKRLSTLNQQQTQILNHPYHPHYFHTSKDAQTLEKTQSDHQRPLDMLRRNMLDPPI